MTATRVVSLAPSATETLSAMGVGDRLVGVTTHCPDVASDPAVVGGWLTPDYDRVAALDPDLVCTSDALQADVRDDLRERGFRVSHDDATTLDGVLDGFVELGRAVGRPDAGERLAADARERLARIAARVDGADRPVVYCEEWSDPPMAAGNWVPDAVAAAGGRYPFADSGERSREVAREAVERADPDHVVLHVCGHGAKVDAARFRDRGWDVDAAVHVVDDAYLNRPAPTLIEGVGRLADAFHGAGTA
ncbi:cobalamin-binding protein [Haloplanus sp. GCM10025708]|uniref:cobalamin-binding protein n=1 Tax=Haloferacaceae TaxID=1644056 RepID=UPI00360D56EA